MPTGVGGHLSWAICQLTMRWVRHLVLSMQANSWAGCLQPPAHAVCSTFALICSGWFAGLRGLPFPLLGWCWSELCMLCPSSTVAVHGGHQISLAACVPELLGLAVHALALLKQHHLCCGWARMLAYMLQGFCL